MKVYYDDEIFLIQKAGGIRTYFTNLILTYLARPELGVEPVLSDFLKKEIYSDMKSNRFYLDRFNFIFSKLKPIKLKFDVDLIHLTHIYNNPCKYPSSIPIVSTIHDMIPEKQSSFSYLPQVIFKKQIIENTNLIAVSKTTKRDILEFFPDLQNRIQVIHHGENEINSISKVSIPFNGKPYFIYVGNRDKYKNIFDLYHAFSDLYFKEMNLIVVGGEPLSLKEKIFLRNLGISGQVSRLILNHAELHNQISSATALICTSTDEGFHYPTLNALKRNTPVIVNNIEIFNELYGEHILRYTSVKELVEHMKFLVDVKFQLPLELKNLVKNYTLDICAEQTANFYHSLN
jgi:glycosyltransferase involved in cell wall biosynthesis